MFEFFAGIKRFQKHKQHTSKDAEFIPLHDDAVLQQDSNATIHQTQDSQLTRCNCTNKLHKCLNSMLQLNIFKNTNNTHQKMQNSSLYTIKDSAATSFKCYKTSNDQIQQLYADTNKLHKCLNFLLELNSFKNTNNTHQKMQNSSLYTIKDSAATRFKCYKTSQTTRFSNCMQTRTNCISV